MEVPSRTVFGLAVSLLLAGCSTMTYTSNRSALNVSECIASGWSKAPHSGLDLPVSLTRTKEYCFVGVELHSLLVTGTKHSSYPVWAEVSDTPSGSITIYHRAYQIMHKKIDRVVVECQGP